MTAEVGGEWLDHSSKKTDLNISSALTHQLAMNPGEKYGKTQISRLKGQLWWYPDKKASRLKVKRLNMGNEIRRNKAKPS